MRNRLILGYFDIDLDVVWSTVKEDIPQTFLITSDYLTLKLSPKNIMDSAGNLNRE